MPRSPALDRQIQAAFTGAREQVQKLFVAEIHRQLDRAKTEARPSHVTQYIDGKKGAPIEGVDAFGVAVFEFNYMRRAVLDLIGILRTTSPVDTGTYQSSHNVFFDGEPQLPIAYKGNGPMSWSPAMLDVIADQTKVTVAPTVEYARLIEQRAKRFAKRNAQVPLTGVYRNAATAISRRWSSVIAVRYVWVDLDVGGSSAYARQPGIELTSRT